MADEQGDDVGAAVPSRALGALAAVVRLGCSREGGEVIEAMLRAARTYLGMEIAFIGEFRDGRRWFRFTDSEPGSPCLLLRGGSDALDATYCQRVVDGRLPRLIRDAAEHPAARELDATRRLPVGAHLSVPIRFSDGRMYGTFCCFSREPLPLLRERDLAVMELLAALVAAPLEHLERGQRTHEATVRAVDAAIRSRVLTTVFQPIIDFADRRSVGYEALTRLPDGTPPSRWFAEADAVGCGARAEVAAVEAALARLPEVPAGCYLSINVSPRVIVSAPLWDALAAAPCDRLVLELTEHSVVDDYGSLESAVDVFREAGGRLAVDDAGAGYASMRHILQLRPDLIKLDMSICRDVGSDPGRAAMVRSFVDLSQSLHAGLVAEGVETDSDFHTLRRLGVGLGQGFLFARPGPLPIA